MVFVRGVTQNRPQVDCMSNSNLVLFLFLFLIICGCRLPVAVTPEQVYHSVDANTVLTVLTHKITRAVRAQVCMSLWGGLVVSARVCASVPVVALLVSTRCMLRPTLCAHAA